MSFSSDSVEVFLAVLDRGSFSAAARSLRRVPSAVSMAIANLEAELQIQLFDRDGREPKPTAAARSLEPQARLIASQLKQLQVHALGLTQGLEKCLTLAIAPELLAAPWSPALAMLGMEHPLLEVEVLAAPQADALEMLHCGRAQLALVFERPSMDGREGFEEVSGETMVAVISPRNAVFVDAGGILREEHLKTIRQMIVAGRNAKGIDPRFVYARQTWRTDNALAALSMITAGLGWGWLPRSFIKPHIAAGVLVEIPFHNLSNGVDLWVDVVWSKERPLGLGAQRFVALMSRSTAKK